MQPAPTAPRREFRLTTSPRVWSGIIAGWILLGVYEYAQLAMIAYYERSEAGSSPALVRAMGTMATWIVVSGLLALMVDHVPMPMTWQAIVVLVIPSIFAATVLAVAAQACFSSGFASPFSPAWQSRIDRAFLHEFHPALLRALLTALLGYALKKKYWFQSQELDATHLKLQLANAEMQVLRSQIQPHFLFNTLHLISSLLRTEPDNAQRVLSRLSDLLRMATDRHHHEVPLVDEIEFASRYVEIQQIRFSDVLSVKWQIDPLLLDVLVPNFLLQPLIENSIKHGLRGSPRVNVSVEASREEGAIVLRVIDDGLARPAELRTRSGVGLMNLHARLDRLYGNRGSLSMKRVDGTGTVVTVRLPMRSQIGNEVFAEPS